MRQNYDDYTNNDEIRGEPPQNNTSRILKTILVSLLGVLTAVTGCAAYQAHKIVSYPYIYNGVAVQDVDLSGSSKEQAAQRLKEVYTDRLRGKFVELHNKDNTLKISCDEINADYDISTSVDKAFSIGRDGSFFEKLSTIREVKQKGMTIPLDVSMNHDILETKLEEFASQINQPVKQYQWTVNGNNLEVTTGESGMMADVQKMKSLVTGVIDSGGALSADVELEPVKPDPIDVEELALNVFSEPEDAHVEVKNYRGTLVPEASGVRFDKEQAKEIIEKNQGSDNKKFLIPVTLTPAKLTQQQLKQTLYKDKLGEYTTKFNPAEINRTLNVKLAGREINDMVLLPGQVFSYNEAVGPRTPEKGYTVAKIFSAGEIVDGLAGGICQISSTLYNAVLKADLKIVSRTNHSFTVTYTPMGQDATVAYGSVDFKFSNNTKNPIKLLCSFGNGTVTIQVLGNNENPNKTIELENKVIKTIPFATKEVKDPSLPLDTTTVKQNGMTGYVVDTYKITKVNGVVTKNEFLSKSTYSTLEKVILKGTGQAVGQPASSTDIVPSLPEGVIIPEGMEVSGATPTRAPSSTPSPAPTSASTPSPTQTPTPIPTATIPPTPAPTSTPLAQAPPVVETSVEQSVSEPDSEQLAPPDSSDE